MKYFYRYFEFTIFAVFPFGLQASMYTTQVDTLVDVFPLSAGMVRTYDFYGIYWHNEALGWRTTTISDSGIVRLTVMSRNENDDAVVWAIHEYDSLLHVEYEILSMMPIDTTYTIVRNTQFTITEQKNGFHELTGSSYMPVWVFPWTGKIHDFNVKPAAYKVYRYALQNEVQLTEKYTGRPYYSDSLLFIGDKGLIRLTTDMAIGMHTLTEYYQTTYLREHLTSVHDVEYFETHYQLNPNYPNPFNPITTVAFSVPRTSSIQLKIFDYLGREIATLVDEEKQPGSYTVHWDASRYSSGIYFCRLYAGSFISTQKMIFLK